MIMMNRKERVMETILTESGFIILVYDDYAILQEGEST